MILHVPQYMPRHAFIKSYHLPYHVSARCLNKEWFRIPLDEVWDIFSNHLFFIHHAFGVRIHAFVLMDNHFHLIISTPFGNLDKAMNYFLRETSRLISKKSGRINQVYGGPYFWSLLKSPHYYLTVYKYLYRNPVEAGLSQNVETYPYSTLRTLLGFEHSIIPVVHDDTLFADVEEQLKWLNVTYPKIDDRHEIKKALRKHEFKFSILKSKKPNPLETQLL